MSVAHFGPRELGVFAATITHLEIVPLDKAIAIAVAVNLGNCGAYNATYRDEEPAMPWDREEIAEVANEYVGDEDALVGASWGPMAYNMVSNGGSVFVGPDRIEESDPRYGVYLTIGKIEEFCKEWHDAKRREFKRREENAVAFNDVGRLPSMSSEEIRAEAESLGYSRIIYAEFGVNESDSMTDYWGGRTARTVVIGYGKGKRENFKELRKAAGNFKPTSHMGLGKDMWTARVVHETSFTDNGRFVREGEWDRTEKTAHFLTEAEAIAHVEEAGKPASCMYGDHEATYRWEISSASFENRENYSMGGGNYLGRNRYGGWKVYSRNIGPGPAKTDDNNEVSDFERVAAKKSKARKKSEPVAEIVDYEESEYSHYWTVKAGKRTIGVSSSKNHPGVTVTLKSSRYGGKHFRSFENASRNYSTATIKAAIEAARVAHESLEAAPEAAPEVDSSEFSELAWL